MCRQTSLPRTYTAHSRIHNHYLYSHVHARRIQSMSTLIHENIRAHCAWMVLQIAAKYRSKPLQLLSDIQKKYQDAVRVPRRVPVCEITRLLALYPVPKEFAALFQCTHTHGCPPTDCVYDCSLDPRNAAFDAHKALACTNIYTRHTGFPSCLIIVCICTCTTTVWLNCADA
jgi:hypothetical protein